MDTLVGCLYTRYFTGTPDEFHGDKEDSFEYWLQRRYPSQEDVEERVAAEVLMRLNLAIEGYEQRDIEVGRWPRCIDDMANMYFQSSKYDLAEIQPKDFRRLPIFLKDPNKDEPEIDPSWEEGIRRYYYLDPVLSMKNHVQRDIPKILEIAARDPFHPIIHFFEDWGHHRLLYFGNPEVKEWLKQLYEAKFDSLIEKIGFGRPDRPTSKSHRRWQNMLSLSGDMGKKDFRYMMKAREVLGLEKLETPFP
ncbi:MAG: hypothetical protein IIA59_06175 [Candidatus Marinimicrobia bacterium]|nr:hypothetical protein [Candidatus Neomarinimicrobiota bacterium]